MKEDVMTDGDTSSLTERRTCHSRVKQSYFLKRDNSSSSTLHLSLRICPSVPSWSDPEYLTLSLDKETPKYGCVHDCGTHKQRGKRSLGRRRRWRQRSYVTPLGSTLNFFGLPTYSQAGLGHKELKEWVREDERRWRRKFWDILIRERREWAGDSETLNSSCLLKSRTFFFILFFLFCSAATCSVIFLFCGVLFFFLCFLGNISSSPMSSSSSPSNSRQTEAA